MDAIRREAISGIQQLERELIVRDFIALLNDGAHEELLPFLTEDVIYRPGPRRCVQGRAAVTRMLMDMHSAFEEWTTLLRAVAVDGDTVLVEQRIRMRVPGTESVDIMGFGSFQLEGAQICAWHQVHA